MGVPNLRRRDGEPLPSSSTSSPKPMRQPAIALSPISPPPGQHRIATHGGGFRQVHGSECVVPKKNPVATHDGVQETVCRRRSAGSGRSYPVGPKVSEVIEAVGSIGHTDADGSDDAEFVVIGAEGVIDVVAVEDDEVDAAVEIP